MHSSISFGSIIGQSPVILTIIWILFNLAQSINLFATLLVLPLNILILCKSDTFLNLLSSFLLVVHKNIFLIILSFFNLKIHKSFILYLEFIFKKCLFCNLLDPDLAARNIPIFVWLFISKINQLCTNRTEKIFEWFLY